MTGRRPGWTGFLPGSSRRHAADALPGDSRIDPSDQDSGVVPFLTATEDTPNVPSTRNRIPVWRIALIGVLSVSVADLLSGVVLTAFGIPVLVSALIEAALIAITSAILAYHLLVRGLLTQLRTAIEDKRRSQRDVATRLDFLATVSHEVRTTLNGIIGVSDLMRRDPSPETVRANVDLIWDNSNTLLRLINDILDFSKIQADNLVLEDIEFDLSEVIHRVAASSAASCYAKGVELILDLRLDVARKVRGDPTRVAQVLSNLLSNAIKFTETGHIVLRAREVGPQADRIRVSFSVTDTGVGIPTDRIPRLFERYTQEGTGTTRQFGGTGLGLAISKSLVHAMGGSIGVTSQVGEGSAFFFSIMFGRSDVSQPPERLSLDGLTIGLVVDQPALWEVLTNGLNHRGATVVDSRSAGAPVRFNENDRSYDALVVDQDLDSSCGCVKIERLRHLPGFSEAVLILLKAPVKTPVTANRSVHLRPPEITDLYKPLSGDDVADKVAELVKGPPAGVDEPLGTHDRPSLDGVRALVADDNVVNRQIMDKLLHVLGAEVDLVEDGEQAVRTVRDSRYDVVLMDIQMPVLDGLGATRAIRESPLPEQPVILGVSGATSESDRAAARDSGMDGFVDKPILLDTLASSIQDRLPRSRRSPE
jgi:signal transduction histidine kinase/CheY-like chemotaxis protein